MYENKNVNNDNNINLKKSNDYFEDACGCKIKWKEKLKNSKLINSYRFKPNHHFTEESFETWEDLKVENFLKSVGGKKYKAGINKPFFEIKINGGESFNYDFLWFEDYGSVHSVNRPFKDLNWAYNQDTITLFTKGLDQNFNFGYIVKKENKAIFIESDENKIERGVMEDKLPSKVLDFCACKCEYMKKGYSEATANESCKDYFEYKNSIYNLPWGNIKEILY